MSYSNLRIERDPHSVATLWIDVPNQPVNTLTRALWDDLDRAIRAFESEMPRRLVIASAKSNSFIAGADLKELGAMSAEALRAYLKFGQAVLNRLEELHCETIAAINGHALGGGLEVALACKHRVAAGAGKFIGLPETTLGLIPGWGGTQRLPRLIGLTPALELLVAGNSVSPNDALKLGLIDQVTAADELVEAARTAEVFPRREPIMPDERDEAIFERFLASARRGAGAHLPAPIRAIDVTRVGWEQGLAAGFAAEIDGLVEMRDSVAGRHLLRNFFLKTSAKSLAGNGLPGTASEVQHVAIIGGGTMGAGIAHETLRGRKKVTLIEVNDAAADAARSRIEKLLTDDANAARMTSEDHAAAKERLNLSTNAADVSTADLIIEAIVEIIEAKTELLNKLRPHVSATAIIASNTSSLGIAEMADVAPDSSRFIGMHFFNPVPRMPLVEIVQHATLSPDTLQTAVAFARKICGKTAVLVNDGPGFIVNRVLMPYLSEALRLVDEGVEVTAVDAALVNWGMPMGPLALIDTIGLDVTKLIFDSLRSALGERVNPQSRSLVQLIAAGSLGRKSGSGFFVYSKDRSERPRANELISSATAKLPEETICVRCVSTMSAEAVRVLEERVATSIEAIDIATLLGMGFPAFRGGLGTYTKELGVDALLIVLRELAAAHGERFKAPAVLTRLASARETLDAIWNIPT